MKTIIANYNTKRHSIYSCFLPWFRIWKQLTENHYGNSLLMLFIYVRLHVSRQAGQAHTELICMNANRIKDVDGCEKLTMIGQYERFKWPLLISNKQADTTRDLEENRQFDFGSQFLEVEFSSIKEASTSYKSK